MTPMDPRFGQRWVASMLATFDREAAGLGELDRRAGDGDFGTNLASAFRRVRSEAERNQPTTYPEWLTAVSRGFLGTGGTSGPLFGMFFRELARCTTEQAPTPAQLADGLTNGLATIQRYGKAQVGHKTMVDALAPAAAAMTEAVKNGDKDPLTAAAQAAAQGARSTTAITARRGRAAYVGEAARGVIDPGAVAMALIIQSARNAAAGSTDAADTAWIGQA
jgi:phosphoenolpyruvate---glycerone phosphotransferase subunit DhaL